MNIVLDIEANGLRDEMDKIWCVAVWLLDTNKKYVFTDQDHPDVFPLSRLPDLLKKTKKMIGHNIVYYDLPVLRDFVGFTFKETICDTLIWSKVLNPDRKIPYGCPTSIPNPVTGKKDIVGPHSLHAWGYRVGQHKPIIHDWTTFSPAIIERCRSDIEINYEVYRALLKEANIAEKEKEGPNQKED